MLDRLKKHHIGIVIDPGAIADFENRLGLKFRPDDVQGVRVAFRWNPDLGLYEEYFTREGRARNYELGFNHVCYDVESAAQLDEIDAYLAREKLGVRLTFPEPSGSEECGVVAFYKIHAVGVVEFNLPRPVEQVR